MSTINTINSDAYITGIQRINSDAYISSNRYSLNSDSFIQEPSSSIVCDGLEVENIVDEFGTSVIVRVVTKSFVDEYGDAEESYTDYSRKAMIQSYSANDEEVKAGVFKSGEIVFTFKQSDEDIVKPGSRIKYGSVWYEIRSINQQPLVDVLYYLTARVQKI